MLDEPTVAILTLLARGWTTQEVACRLRVPPETVRERLVLAMTTLGCGSRLETIVEARRRGIIHSDRTGQLDPT